MDKKKKDPTIEAHEKLKNEIIIEKVDEVFRTQKSRTFVGFGLLP